MMTSTIRKFGVGVASLALVAGVSAPAFAAPGDETNTLPGFHINDVARLSGLDRIDTSFAVASHEFKTEGKGGLGHDAKVAYIVNYRAFTDAATAGMLTDGPIVFVDNNRRTSSIVGKFLGNSDEAKGGVNGFRGIRKIIAVGGEAVVSNDTLAAVAKAANVPTTERIGGKDRYETSVQIAERIYSQASEGTYKGRVSVDGDDNRISRVYFANGADNHVVDSMVAGVLDNGPILLVEGSGDLPEATAEFLKKTLPTSYGILGGSGAVSDTTVANARQLAVYGNNWEEAPKVPTYKALVDELKHRIDGKVVDGVSVGQSRVLKSSDFMGYKKTAAEGQNLNVQWSAKYNTAMANATSVLSTTIKSGTGVKVNAAYAAVENQLVALYGNFADTQAKVENYFQTDGKGNVEGFDFAGFEATELKQNVADAQSALNTLWGKGEQAFAELNNQVAKTSQVDPSSPSDKSSTSFTGTGTSVTNDVPLASVKIVAAWVADVQAKQLENTKKQLADAQAKLAAGLNQIDRTAEVRLGGKDRFETAAAVAQEWAKSGYYKDMYSSYGTKKNWPDVYVANAWALPDAIVAGQLSGGPILLGNNGDEVQKVTKAVAASLPLWQVPTADKTLYGIGGTKVLSEAQLRNIASVIDDTVESRKPAASELSVNKASQTVRSGAQPADVLVRVKGITPVTDDESFGVQVTAAAKLAGQTNTPATSDAPVPTMNENGKITFANSDVLGKYTYTVTGKGDFKDMKTTTFTIEVVEAVYELKGGEVEYKPGEADVTVTNGMFAKNDAKDDTVTAPAGDIFVTARPAGTAAANDPEFKIDSGDLKVTQKALGIQGIGEYTIKYTKDSKDYTAKVTVKEPAAIADADAVKIQANHSSNSQFDLDSANGTYAAETTNIIDAKGLKVGTKTATVGPNSTKDAVTFSEALAAGDHVVLKTAAGAYQWYKITE